MFEYEVHTCINDRVMNFYVRVLRKSDMCACACFMKCIVYV